MLRQIASFVVGLLPIAAHAQSYPARGVKIIVALNAGSPVDGSARVLAGCLQARLGQGFVVENRPGAGTSIGTKAAAGADPDGYTLLFSGSSIASLMFLYPAIELDVRRNFTAVASVASWNHVVAVAPGVPARTIGELVAHAKANPGKLVFGYGLGTAPHILGATFREATGADLTFLPYRGGEQARTDLLGGRVHINIAPGNSLLPVIQDGKARALAVTGLRRDPVLPDIPTMAESGYPGVGYHPDVWVGLLAPAGTPGAILSILENATGECTQAPDVVAALARMGMEPMRMGARAFGDFIADELVKWPPRLAAAGLKPQ